MVRVLSSEHMLRVLRLFHVFVDATDAGDTKYSFALHIVDVFIEFMTVNLFLTISAIPRNINEI